VAAAEDNWIEDRCEIEVDHQNRGTEDNWIPTKNRTESNQGVQRNSQLRTQKSKTKHWEIFKPYIRPETQTHGVIMNEKDKSRQE